VIIKRGEAEDGDIPEGSWALPASRVNHLEYAWTWFLIAATLVGVYLAATLKRIPPGSSPSGV
jgi:cytochrome oxidase assembly protein ShyY1